MVGAAFCSLPGASMMMVACRSKVYVGSQFCVIAVYTHKYVLCCVLGSLICRSVTSELITRYVFYTY